MFQAWEERKIFYNLACRSGACYKYEASLVFILFQTLPSPIIGAGRALLA